MSYPRGYLYQPPGSLALYSCPAAYGAARGGGVELLARSAAASSGSSFTPYQSSASAFSAQAASAAAAAAECFGGSLHYPGAGGDPTAGFPAYMGSPYDAHATGMTGAISYHPYGSPAYPYQLNDPAYRKNATRETTSTLKAWLQEHRKNPYPTKGEKIMLAIITKMTLTQVSTWFANARRRLKKENKVTWGARSKEDDHLFGSDNEGDPDKNEDDEEIDLESIDIDKIDDNDGEQSNEEEEEKVEHLRPGRDLSFSGTEELKTKDPLSPGKEPPDSHSTHIVSPGGQNIVQGASHSKPKIWSLAETATSPDHTLKSSSPLSQASHTPPQIQHPAFLSSHGLYTCQIGKFHNWTNGAFLAQSSLLNVRSLLGVNHHHGGPHTHHHLQSQQHPPSSVLTATLGAQSTEKTIERSSPKHTERENVPRNDSQPPQLQSPFQPVRDNSLTQQEGTTRILAALPSA